MSGKIAEFMQEYGVAQFVEDNVKIGFMHSHHTMATTPSGTDITQVQELAGTYDYFVSLIVNTAGSYTLLVGYEVEIEGTQQLRFKNDHGVVQQLNVNQNHTQVQIDYGTFYHEFEVSEDFKRRVAELNKPVVKHVGQHYNAYNSYEAQDVTVSLRSMVRTAFEDFLKAEDPNAGHKYIGGFLNDPLFVVKHWDELLIHNDFTSDHEFLTTLEQILNDTAKAYANNAFVDVRKGNWINQIKMLKNANKVQKRSLASKRKG